MHDYCLLVCNAVHMHGERSWIEGSKETNQQFKNKHFFLTREICGVIGNGRQKNETSGPFFRYHQFKHWMRNGLLLWLMAIGYIHYSYAGNSKQLSICFEFWGAIELKKKKMHRKPERFFLFYTKNSKFLWKKQNWPTRSV